MSRSVGNPTGKAERSLFRVKIRERPLAMLGGNFVLTRRQVAERLGVSVSTVRRNEFSLLHPIYDERGVWRFDPQELTGLKLRRRVGRKSASRRRRHGRAAKGVLAARVFTMLERGASFAEIVIALKVEPTKLRRLYRAWRGGFDG